MKFSEKNRVYYRQVMVRNKRLSKILTHKYMKIGNFEPNCVGSHKNQRLSSLTTEKLRVKLCRPKNNKSIYIIHKIIRHIF